MKQLNENYKLEAKKLNQELSELKDSLMVFNIETIVEKTFNQDLDKNIRFYFDLDKKEVYTKNSPNYKVGDLFLVKIPKVTTKKALKSENKKDFLLDDLERHWGDVCKHTLFRYACKNELKMSKEAIEYENMLEKTQSSKNYFKGEFTPKIIDDDFSRKKLISYLDNFDIEEELNSLSGLWAAFAYMYGEENNFSQEVNRSFAYIVSALLTGVGRSTGTHIIFDEDKIEKTLRSESLKIEKEDIENCEKYRKFFFKIFNLYKNNIDDYRL